MEGKICAQGDIKAILKNKDSITAKYLSGKREIKVPKKELRSIPKKLQSSMPTKIILVM